MSRFLQLESLSRLRKQTAFLGFLGASLMLIGDLLLYGNFGDIPSTQPWVTEFLPARSPLLLADSLALNASTLLGPIAAMLYVGGSVHLFLIFERRKFVGFFVAIASAAAFIGSGAYHAQFGIVGHVARHANNLLQSPASLLESVETTLQVLNTFVQIAWLFAFSALFVGILTGSTQLPRRFAWISPLLPIAVLIPLVESRAVDWPSPWSGIAAGGIYNFLMALCFLAFLVASRSREHLTSKVR